jgi:hypothetical protein
VLDPEILAIMRVGPTRNVAGGKDFRCAGLQEFVDDDGYGRGFNWRSAQG